VVLSLRMRRTVPSLPVCPSISRVILYVKDIQKVATFYEAFFGMKRMETEATGWLELTSPSGGCLVALHQASKTQKSGAAVKPVFGVRDVRGFAEAAALRGLNYEFANAKDPAGNSISISSRGIPRLSRRTEGSASRSAGIHQLQR